MSRQSALQRHPDRARLENELLSGRNILQISAETNISSASLYRARAELIAEKEAQTEATQDASRLGAARRYALLAANARRARQDANLKGNTRLAKDLLETERKILNDIVNVSPEVERNEEARENQLLAGALVEVLGVTRAPDAFRVTLEYLKAQKAPQHIIDVVKTTAARLIKESV